MNQKIKFFCYENDPGFEVALEPEGFTWRVNENDEIIFIAKDTNDSFYWSVRHEPNYVQVFPESNTSFPEIEVYKNGQLIQYI